MNGNERDRQLLRHMISYCEQIEATVERFGRDGALFQADLVYHNAVSLCILQIGELAGGLSEEFRAAYPQIPWRKIKQMRNIVAHRYGTVDHAITWEVTEEEIPVLKDFCRSVLCETDEDKGG